MKQDNLKLSTICVHGGESLDAQGGIHIPLYNHSTFGFKTTADLLDVVEGRKTGNLYTRYGLNPTVQSVENKLTLLEKGETAYLFSSGMAAEAATFLTYCKTGDHIICVGDVYGGTYELLNTNLPELGIKTTFLLGSQLDQLANHIQSNTRLVFFETPTNPNLEILDISYIVSICKSKGVLCIIDNTFASPVNQNPLELGVDIVIHSTTKYLGGHSDITGGVVIGSKEVLSPIWIWRKNLGQMIAPEVAFLLARSIRTLKARVSIQNESAMKIAGFLSKHKKVTKVNYPGLESFSGHEIAKKQMKGFGGMLSFIYDGNAETTAGMVDRLKLFSIAASLGGVESLVTQPITTTHHGMSPDERNKRGIADSMVRLSIGLEDAEDLIEDLKRALG